MGKRACYLQFIFKWFEYAHKHTHFLTLTHIFFSSFSLAHIILHPRTLSYSHSLNHIVTHQQTLTHLLKHTVSHTLCTHTYTVILSLSHTHTPHTCIALRLRVWRKNTDGRTRSSRSGPESSAHPHMELLTLRNLTHFLMKYG